MKKKILLYAILILSVFSLLLLIAEVLIGTIKKGDRKRQISVMTLNIWQEGTVVDGGYAAIVDEIARLTPDFVTLSEVRNYRNIGFCDRLIQSLKKKGLTYYTFLSDDSGLLSKYPITDSMTIFAPTKDHGSIYKLKTIVDGIPFAVYTAHLDYMNCAYYLPRGYCGNTWMKLDKPVLDNKKIEEMNLASKRDEAIMKFIEDANEEYKNGVTIILGGDFNEPSNQDWTYETKDLYDHNGLVYKWTVTSQLALNGYVDCYRKIYPSAIQNPGFTYPCYNKDVPLEKLTWAPEADERERIDYIFYRTKRVVNLISIQIVGPKACVKKNQKNISEGVDKFIEPLNIWPSDHKGLFAVFEL